jgi:Fanconi anemia group M protein
MSYIRHDFIKPDFVQKRSYQVNIYRQTRDKHSLIVLPTGLGKTIIAILVLAHRFQYGKIFFLAPTKPLCEQHYSLIKKITTFSDEVVTLITSETCPRRERLSLYASSKLIVATPQTIQNDLEKNLSLKDCSLIIFDEAHRAVGSYAYVPVSRRYLATGELSQILALTASPGSSYPKLVEVAKNLGIEHVEIRTELDDDVKSYIPYRKLNWHVISMPPEIKKIRSKIDTLLIDYLAQLQKYTRQAKGLKVDKLSKRALIDIQGRMRKNLGKRGGTMYQGLSLISAAIKLSHLRDVLTSQGIDVARKYLNKLAKDSSRAAQRIRKSPIYTEISHDIFYMVPSKTKIDKAKEIIIRHFRMCKDPKIIVFAEYRDTIDFLIKEFSTITGVHATPFIGQARAKEGGMSQDQQKKTLNDFRRGIYNVLVSTSIGEEGIDIPATSLVLFYEPVPSAIRYIQRKGRTARDGVPGNVQILIMEGSRDEAAYWSSIRKEKKMYDQVYRLQRVLEKKISPPFVGQTRIDYF